MSLPDFRALSGRRAAAEPLPDQLERTFWKAAGAGGDVHCAADIPAPPTAARSAGGGGVGWDLGRVAESGLSLFRLSAAERPAAASPRLSVGMRFGGHAGWAIEEAALYLVSYNHPESQPRVTYAIPGGFADRFEAALADGRKARLWTQRRLQAAACNSLCTVRRSRGAARHTC